jgi:hypothetical protein
VFDIFLSWALSLSHLTSKFLLSAVPFHFPYV